DLRLVLAVDLEGDRLVEPVLRPAVERGELLAVELEGHGHHGALLARPGRAVARDVGDARVREDRRVEARGLLALRVEPQPGGAACQRSSFPSGAACRLETGAAAGTHRSDRGGERLGGAVELAAELLRQLDERDRGRRAVAVAVPCDPDDARWDPRADVDGDHAVVARVDGEL